MDILEIETSLIDLQTELDKVLPFADPSISILVKSQNLLFKNLMSMTSDLKKQNDEMQQQNKMLLSTIADLQETINDLKRQLNQNSQNSSKPPSADGYKRPKPKSMREKSGKKPGGQKGHAGAHMTVPHAPDETVLHYPKKCQKCKFLQRCINSENAFECAEKRYEADIEFRTVVTEHQAMKVCKCMRGPQLCGARAEFPDGINSRVRYGDNFAVLCSILNTYGAVSHSRIATIIRNIAGVSLSEGTVNSMVARCADKVEDAVDKTKKLLQESAVVHFDETGVRVGGRLHRVHNSSSGRYTYLTVSQKRGEAGIADNGVLPAFGGVAVHDCWASYFNFEIAGHAVCGVHLLREMNCVIENENLQTWAAKFKDFLLKWLKTTKEYLANGINELPDEKIKSFENEYDEIIKIAETEFPEPKPDASAKKRGRPKKGRVRALIERLIKYKDAVSRFVRDLAVPFDNNQAERDVRNIKTKAKVSGCFRSEDGAKNYLKIMSYIGTAAKNGINAYDALVAAFKGNSDIIFAQQGSEQ